MVGPPDSKNPPTASAAEEQHRGDLTRNGPTSAGDFDAVPDPRLEPEVDSSATFAPEHVPPERRDSVPPGALTQAQPPPVDTISPHFHIIWPDDDADRSWWSRLRSLKASWETKHLRRSAHDEPVTTEADRLGPAARTGDVTMEAIGNLETHLASLTALRDVCASIDRRLARVEEVSGQGDRAAIDEALHDVCSQMSDRLVRVEAAVQRTEGFVAEKPWDLSTIAHTRLEYVEQTLRLTQQSLADSTLPEMCASIDSQLVQARMALQRTEEAVADKTLHELCKNIDARLERTEGTLHRREGIVAEWLQELSARMTVRFAEAEETIQRIERIVSRRTGEQTPAQQPSVPHATSESREPENGGFVNIKQTNRPTRLPWIARLAVPVLALLAAFAIGALIGSSRGVPPEKVAPLTTTNQISIPVVPATNEGIRAPSTTALIANAPRSSRESGVSAPQQRSTKRESAPTTTQPPRFVGTLSITSVPSGASVSLNGKPAGVTPLKLPRQRAGSVAVQVRHDGFEGWSAAVLVPADQLTQVTAKLRASATPIW